MKSLTVKIGITLGLLAMMACQPASPPATSASTTTTTTGTSTTSSSTTTVKPTSTTTTTAVPIGRWMPTPAERLTYTWVLGDVSNLTPQQVYNLQTKDLAGNPIPTGDVYELDGDAATAAQVAYLQSKGKRVVCYYDGGVYEDYRVDAHRFPASVIGKPDEGWEGSWWLDIRQVNILKPIMETRTQTCADKGFDAVIPDEVTNWSNDSGFPLTYQDQLIYNRMLAKLAHDRGLTVGLKGDIEQVQDLVGDFDFTLNEECYQYKECTNVYNPADGQNHPGLQVFVEANKAVWVAEYKQVGTIASCTNAISNRFNLSWYKLDLGVNRGRTDCGSW